MPAATVHLHPFAAMKASELREMSDEQLELTLKEACEKLFRLRFQSTTERLETPSEITKNRRLIARIKTLQTERARAAAAKQETASATAAAEV